MNLNNLFNNLDQQSLLVVDDNIKLNILKLKTSYEFKNKKISLFKVLTYTEFINHLTYIEKNSFILHQMITDNLPISVINEKIKFSKYNFDHFTDLKSFIDNADKHIIKNNDFFDFVKDKKLYFLEDPIYVKKFLNLYDLNYEVIKNNYNHSPSVLKFSSKQHEILYLFENIAKLLEKNIKLNDIYISNVTSEDIILLKRYAKSYNIPVNFNEKIKIYDLSITKNLLKLDYDSFINLLKDKDALKVFLKNHHITDEELFFEVIKKIVSVVNKYPVISDKEALYKLIKFDIKSSTISLDKYLDAIQIVDLNQIEFIDSHHIFIINAVYEQFPSLEKDNAYLSDKDKTMIGYPSSKDINVFKYNKLSNLVKRENITYISYALKDLYKTYSGSDVITKYNKNDKDQFDDLTIDDLNKGYAIDLYKEIFNNTIKGIPLITFNPEFNYNMDEKNILKTYLKQISIKFSPTSFITYLKSPFIYYIKEVLKISDFETNISTRLGNFFHLLVEVMYKIKFSKNVILEKTVFDNQLILDYIENKLDHDLDLNIYFEDIKNIFFHEEITHIEKIKNEHQYINIDSKLAIESLFFVDKNKSNMINALNHLIKIEEDSPAKNLILEKELQTKHINGRPDLIRIDHNDESLFSIIDFKSSVKATLNADNILLLLNTLDIDFDSKVNISELGLLQLFIYIYMYTYEKNDYKLKDIGYFSFLEKDLRLNSVQTVDVNKDLYKNRKIELETYEDILLKLDQLIEEVHSKIKNINFNINIRESIDYKYDLKSEEFINYQAIAMFSKYEIDFEELENEND